MPGRRYYEEPLLAYVRARTGAPAADLPAALEAARQADVRVHRFKRTGQLPRVGRVLGLLRGLRPAELLDVGSGRGAFLWPLLDSFPTTPVTTIDRSDRRSGELAAVATGVGRLSAHAMDATQMTFTDRTFDVSCALEVLEHMVQPAAAARELVRVSRRFIVASVPSRPDDNPEHIQLFSVDALEALFLDAGARRVAVEHVLNHRIAVVSL